MNYHNNYSPFHWQRIDPPKLPPDLVDEASNHMIDRIRQAIVKEPLSTNQTSKALQHIVDALISWNSNTLKTDPWVVPLLYRMFGSSAEVLNQSLDTIVSEAQFCLKAIDMKQIHQGVVQGPEDARLPIEILSTHQHVSVQPLSCILQRQNNNELELELNERLSPFSRKLDYDTYINNQKETAAPSEIEDHTHLNFKFRMLLWHWAQESDLGILPSQLDSNIST